jgi:HEAT repeat protein
MTSILDWLDGGDLRSDGAANPVADAVNKDLKLIPELIDGLHDERDVVRGRAADVLEKVARKHPEEFMPHLNSLLAVLEQAEIPMVRWHLAMLLGHLVPLGEEHESICAALISRLSDDSVFTISWAIVSLCILARSNPSFTQAALHAIRPLSSHSSVAVRAKVRYAIPLITKPETEFPSGWIKSEPTRSKL